MLYALIYHLQNVLKYALPFLSINRKELLYVPESHPLCRLVPL